MMLTMADPRTSMQLIHGFYQLEGGAWRWTGKDFGVALRTPPDAAKNGAQLLMRVTIPQPQLAAAHSFTLSARVNGAELPPEAFSTAGDILYQRKVPASALTQELATIEFSLDKTAPPVPPDIRALGIVVTSVGFMGSQEIR